jgi:cytoskeletal protein RodZ
MAEKKCNNCGTNSTPASVPYVAHESAMARSERHIKALILLIVLLIVLLVGSNGAWLWYENQFDVVEETTTTITQDNADGYNNYIGNDGDIVNGKTDNNN